MTEETIAIHVERLKKLRERQRATLPRVEPGLYRIGELPQPEPEPEYMTVSREIRAMGEQLASAGGIKLMLRVACDAYGEQSSGPSEWNGISGWMA
jgi:hypothetical protein